MVVNKRFMKDDKRFSTFVTDDDGLSVEDALTIAIITFFIITKLVHMYIITKYPENKVILDHYIVVMDDINAFTNIIILFYFGGNTFNKGANKVIDGIKISKDLKEKKKSEEIKESIGDLLENNSVFERKEDDNDGIG